MKESSGMSWRAAERGAVSIKAILTVLMLSVSVFVLIKVIPLYVEQRQVLHEVDELARKAAVRGLKQDRIQQDILKIVGEFNLPENSIALGTAQNQAQNVVQIVVGYSKNIDFLVTTYTWRVDHTAVGREL